MGFMSKEEDYELVLLVKIKGHGTTHHQKKTAARLKRLLEVGFHTEMEVLRQVNHSVNVIPEVEWEPVERDDSNAYVSEER